MSKIRRGNYTFLSWIGDHGHHVHVYRKGKQILKWDLDENKIIKGKLSRKLYKIITKLNQEGAL